SPRSGPPCRRCSRPPRWRADRTACSSSRQCSSDPHAPSSPIRRLALSRDERRRLRRPSASGDLWADNDGPVKGWVQASARTNPRAPMGRFRPPAGELCRRAGDARASMSRRSLARSGRPTPPKAGRRPAMPMSIPASPEPSPRTAADSKQTRGNDGASPAGDSLTDLEFAIAGIWEELIGTAPTRPEDDWYELGGHSLAAIRLANRVRERFGVQLETTVVFEASSLRSYAARVAEAGQGAAASVPAAATAAASHDAALGVPATRAQAALWLLAQLPETGSAYNVAQAITIEGEVDPVALSDALAALAERHDALRARFVPVDGEPHMVVEAHASLELAMDAPDAARASQRSREEIDAIVTEFVEAPFDLGRAPLMRAKLVATGERRHLLLIAAHHIVTDGWSIGVITNDLAELYRARVEGRPLRLAALDSSFAAYVAEQSRLTDDARTEASIAYWRERLSGLEPLPLPLDRQRGRQARREGDRVEWRIDGQSLAALSELARREAATPFMGFLAVFGALLMRHCRHEDIAVGTPVALRHGLASESLVGYCINTLVLRNDLGGNPSFLELLR